MERTQTRYYAIKNKRGDFVKNILEVSEGWCWALFYANHSNVKKNERVNTLPSQVPPDFIRGMNEIGYRCVELAEVERGEG